MGNTTFKRRAHRWVALVVVAMAVPVVGIASPAALIRADNLDVPICAGEPPSGQNINCVVVPPGGTAPVPVTDSVPSPDDPSYRLTPVHLAGIVRGPICEDTQPIPGTNVLPMCTRRYASAFLSGYVPGAATGVSQSELSSQQVGLNWDNCGTGGYWEFAVDVGCDADVSWPSNWAGASTLIISIAGSTETSTCSAGVCMQDYPSETNRSSIVVHIGSSMQLNAAFTANEDASQAGFVHNVSTSPADAVHTWDFGDGNPPMVGSPSIDHQYTKPGTYTVGLTVAKNGETSTTTRQIVIAAPTVQVAVTAVSGLGTASVGDTITMKVALTASATGLGNVNVAPTDVSQLLAASGGFADVVDNTAPASVTLAPGDTQQFTATFTATGIGSESFAANFQVTDTAGATTTVSGSKVITIRARALTVTVTVTPTGVVQPEDADGPKPVTVNVTAVVKNVLDTPLDNVSVDVNPTFVWTAPTPSPVPFPMASTTPAMPSEQIGTLDPGQSATVTYVESALDDVLLNVQVLAIGFPTGSSTRVSGLGVAPLEVKPKYDFRFSAKPEEQYSGPNPVTSQGSTIDFFLNAKNLTNTKNLVVPALHAQFSGNAVAGGGNPFPITQASARPVCAAPISLKLNANSSEQSLQSRITTVDLGQGVGNFVTVSYQPSVFEVNGTTFTQIDPTRILTTDGTKPTTVRLEPDIVVPPYSFGDAAFGFTDASFRRLAATGQAMFQLIPTLLAMVPSITKWGNPFMWPYAMADRMVTYWGSLGPAERANLVNTVIGDLALAGVKFTDFAINLQGIIPAWVDEFATAVNTGNTQHMGAMLGTVTADIGVQLLTDQAVGAIAEQIALCRLSQIPKAAAETAEADIQARHLAELTAGDKKLAQLTEKDSKLLATGLLADPEIAYRVYGINAQQLADLYKLAREEGILIEIRPNGGYRHDWLEKLAALKPEVLKLKTVSPLDVYLGYLPEDLGSLVLKKPQTAQEFATIYSKVAGEQGSLVADALKVRWEQRTAEWANGDMLTLYKGFQEEGLPVGFNGTDNGLIGPNQARRVKFDLGETAPGSGYYRLEMQKVESLVDGVEVSNDLRRITGDIDLLDIRLANGQPVPPARRLEIYRALEEIAGIQHPSVTTWMKNGQASFPAKLAFYEDLAYTPGKATEAALEVAPDAKSRIVRTVMSVSWIDTVEDSFIFYKGGYLDLEYNASMAPGWTPKPPVTTATATGPTVITQAVRAGAQIVPVTAYGTITVGSSVVIDPGRPNQETATVVQFHSLDLAAPLKFDHNVGEVIIPASEWSPSGSLTAFVPARLLDTRGGATVDGVGSGGGVLGVDQRLVLPVAGRGGVPVGAAAAVLNVVVTQPAAAGYLVVWPCSEPRPLASSLNFDVGWTVANSLVVALSGDGSVCVESSVAGVHVIADVTAWTTAPA